MDPVFRSFTLRGAAAKPRLGTFQGREHLVVPVIALMEGVIFAHNAEAPEFVPAEVLARMPAQWNGRPVVIDHPEEGGVMVSAAMSPAVLEREWAGAIFASGVRDGKRLTMEAWIDQERALALGSKGAEMVERILAAEASDPIEVSVGALVLTEPKAGSYKGRPYYATWKEIGADHLALLSKGTTGACSNSMGCGVRAAHQVTESGLSVILSAEGEEAGGMKDRLGSLYAGLRGMLERMAAVPDDMTDRDLRRALDNALRASVPAYLGIVEVTPGKEQVIFEAMPEGQFLTYRQSFSVGTDGKASLKGKPIRVEPRTEYEPVKAAAAQGCGCADPGSPTVAAVAPPTPSGGAMKTKTERVAALIANPRSTFSEQHRAALEAAPDDHIAALEALVSTLPEPKAADPAPAPAATTAPADRAAAAAPAAPSAPVVAPAASAPAPAAAPAAEPVTLDALISQASPEIREHFASLQRETEAAKEAAITALKGSGRCSFSDAELKAKPLGELKALVALLPSEAQPKSGDVSYAGLGLPRERQAGEGSVDAPPSLDDKIRAARKQA